MLKLCPLMVAILDGDWDQRTKFESSSPKDYPCNVCFKLAYWFQREKLNIFPC